MELQPISLDRVVDNVLHDYPSLSPEKAKIEVQHPLLPVCGHEAFLSQAVSNPVTILFFSVPSCYRLYGCGSPQYFSRPVSVLVGFATARSKGYNTSGALPPVSDVLLWAQRNGLAEMRWT
jgi:hypothetical protein